MDQLNNLIPNIEHYYKQIGQLLLTSKNTNLTSKLAEVSNITTKNFVPLQNSSVELLKVLYVLDQDLALTMYNKLFTWAAAKSCFNSVGLIYPVQINDLTEPFLPQCTQIKELMVKGSQDTVNELFKTLTDEDLNSARKTLKNQNQHSYVLTAHNRLENAKSESEKSFCSSASPPAPVKNPSVDGGGNPMSFWVAAGSAVAYSLMALIFRPM